MEAMCGRCAGRYRVPPRLVGKQFRCKKCGGIVITAPAGASTSPPPVPVDPAVDPPADELLLAMQQAAAGADGTGDAEQTWRPSLSPPPLPSRGARAAGRASLANVEPWMPRIALSDELARLISQALILSTIGVSIWAGYGASKRQLDAVPDAFRAQLWVYIVILSVWLLLV